jgi:hypothetical protein
LEVNAPGEFSQLSWNIFVSNILDLFLSSQFAEAKGFQRSGGTIELV